MFKKPPPLKQFDKFDVLSGTTAYIKERKEEKENERKEEEERKRQEEEERKKQEEKEKQFLGNLKTQQDVAKYQKRVDAGEITVEQANKEYQQQLEKEQEERTTVIKDDKKLTWDQVKKDDNLYNSLTLNEKRKLARGNNLKTFVVGGEDISTKKEISTIDDRPNVAQDLLSHLGRGWTSTMKGVSNQTEAMQYWLAQKALKPQTKEEKIGLYNAVKKINQGMPGSTAIPDSKYDDTMAVFDRNIRQYENESITEDLKDGNYAQAGYRTLGAAIESMPS